jgi:hypothetical protein
VTSLTLATIVYLPLLAGPAETHVTETYADAHRKTVQNGQVMIVMVGADWCPACVQMANNVIPQIRKRGLFRRVAYAHVNLDQDRDLGAKLTAGGPIPQLIVYRRTPTGWFNRRLIGGQSVQAVEQLISTELAAQADTTATSLAKDQKPAQQPSAQQQAVPASAEPSAKPTMVNVGAK